MRWVLFEDLDAARLRPFTRLRPPSGLLLGAMTLADRWRLAVAPEPLLVACRPMLAATDVGLDSWADACAEPEENALWISDQWIPDLPLVEQLRRLPPDHAVAAVGDPAGGVRGFRVGPRIARLLRESAEPRDALAAMPGAGVELHPEAGRRVSGLADLVRWQEPLLRADLDRILAQRTPAASFGDGAVYQPERIRLGIDCRIDHGAVLDAREGPIVLGDGCHIFPHTWIRGPFFADRHCLLLGGRIGGATSLGPACRVRGEVEASVFLGWSNKAHDGFIGHSYLGEWVNLGALTTNSDLKNNYSVIQLERDHEKETTGLKKVGVFLGDHVKTRIGCVLNCGTIVGVGANLFGDPAVGVKSVPDFGWGWGAGSARYDVERFLETAEIVFGRRGVPWTPAMAALLRAVHAEG